ncbi:MAG: YibE/F family protein [Bacillota bacterium]|nr:YibE/F family protein [Bacillota bacterium]
MNIIIVLLIILLTLMIAVGGKRGAKSFFALCMNFVTLFIMLLLMAFRLDPVKVTILGSVIITSITLFYINGWNRKTVSSLLSVLLAVLLTMLLTYKAGTGARIQGFSYEQSESISSFSLYIQLNFSKLVICQILIGLLGAIIDVSITISSSMNELRSKDPSMLRLKLFFSGMNIGKDILGTMTNTLLFAYIGGFMTLVIYFNELHYSFADIINSKIFCTEAFQALSGGIGIILIIPITALAASRILK